jgi:glucose uptake protein GlcU
LKDLKSYKILGIGMFQGIGNLGSIFAILVNTNVIASPMTQFSVVIGTLLGIFYMKEKPPKPYLTITLIGLGLIIVGAISCGFSNVILGIE